MVNRLNKLDKSSKGIAQAFRNLAGRDVSKALSGAVTNQLNMAGYKPMKNGSKGTIKTKTQKALLHKGEVVLTAGQVKSLKKILK
jgi:hypothetical protein